MSEFFGSYFMPVYLARDKVRTRDLYQQVVDLFIAEVDDLEISKISPLHCEQFVTAALNLVNPRSKTKALIAPATVAKYCRHINTVFLKMAKPGYRNRDAFGIIDSPPFCKPPKLATRLRVALLPSGPEASAFAAELEV